MQKYLFTIILLFFVNINFVLAYNNTIVHPGITNEAIKLYLRSGNEGKITSKQSASILKGAENEDIDPRYLNHFYNPYNNQSLEVLGATFSTAKEWAFKQNSETGDYSVSTILDNYREGNTKRAFEGIGHILHLVQDMGTPAHVRVDPHPPWEPDGLELATEEYAKYPFVDAKYSKKEIGNIFDEFAKYTIDNFYSNDRIDNNIILTDFTTREEADGKIHTYGVKDDHIVCHIKKAGEGKKCELIDFVYKYYWQELHPKTVTYSASTIDWFMDEFEKIDEENEKLSFWDKVSNKIVSLPSAIWKSRNYVWGDTYLATRDSAISNIRGVFLGAVDVSYYSGIAFDVGIRSTSEIVKEGSIGTLESMGEASLLAGAGIEKTFDFSVGVGEKTVSLIKEGVAETNEVIVGLPKVLGLESEEFVLEQEHTPSADTDTPLPPEADRQERGIEEGGWVPRTNILLFTGGSSGSDDDGSVLGIEEEIEEDIIASSSVETQDLNLISFNVFDTSSNSSEFTSSTTVGANIEISSLENLEYYLSESSSTENIIWSDVIPSSFLLSNEDGQKNINLFVRDSESGIILESSIILDLNLPVVEIISGPAYYSSSTEASFLFTANCVPSLFKYSFNNEDFQVSDLSESISEGRVFNEESNILEIKIKDRLGRSASTSFEWIIDTTPPEVIFGDTTFSENEILINWEIASSTRDGSPFKYFELEEFIDGAFFDSFIVEANIFSRAISTQDNMSFRIRAVDMAGNIGEWVDKVIIILPESNHILISEVGIIGTEFIELYNPTEEDFLISSWYLAYYPAERDWYNPYRLLEIRPAEIESRGFF